MIASTRPVLLRHDRLTWLIYFQIGIYGGVGFVLGSVVTIVARGHGISPSVAGLHGTAMAAGCTLAGFSTAFFVAR